MFKASQYTYYLRKKDGLIVLGKVQGLGVFDGRDLFPFFMGQKRLAWREIRKFVIEGRGVLIAQDEQGLRSPLGIPSCLFGGDYPENPPTSFCRKVKRWMLKVSHKEIVF